jgi:FkbM family methyltransferase
MTYEAMFKELHPPGLLARVARQLRAIQHVPGVSRLINLLASGTPEGQFCIRNAWGEGKLTVAGDISSFIDREVYLKGGYENQQLEAFLARIPPNRRRTILDIGANIGTHSLCFAKAFRSVHAFEPNPSLWTTFQRNIALNAFTHVRLHQLGLADRNAELALHIIDKNNFGLGTFSTAEQYDLPLKEVCKAKVVVGDRYLHEERINDIDAVKIDVQGFEPEVLRGLHKTLERWRPIVWCEVAGGTTEKIETAQDLLRLLPGGYTLSRFVKARRWQSGTNLTPVSDGPLPHSDYLAMPLEITVQK